MLVLRSLLFNAGFFGLTALAGVLALPLLTAPRQWTLAVQRGWARVIIAMMRVLCGITLRVEGREHLPAKGPALIAAKHQSAFDTIVWFLLVPDPVYVLKAELFRIPVWGWHARHTRMIGVDRKGGASAMRGMLREAREAAAEGRQIVIFPEGTRVAPGARAPYQPGIVALAGATALPVIPVATNSGRLWGRRSFVKRPGEIVVKVLEPLPAGLTRAELLGALEARIEAAQEQL
jgi:1-acyl-sn-glycerol-3-phosphate acyltransferase